MAYEEGLKIQENSVCSNKICLGYISKNSFTKVANVNFGEGGATSVTVNASSNSSSGGKVEFHLDSKNGDLIASVEISSTGGWDTFKDFEAEVTGATGVHDLYIVFKGDSDYPCNVDYWQFFGDGSEEELEEIAEEKQTPFHGTPASIPGKIEAEDYDLGGEGKAYHDESSANEGGAYRKDNVDIEETSASNYVVGYNIKGEWLEYTVDVKESAEYEWTARVSSTFEESGFRLYLDDKDITGRITVPQGEEWSDYTLIKGKTKELSAGEHVLKLAVESSYFNIDYIEFKGEDATGIETISLTPNLQPGDYMLYNATGEFIGSIRLPKEQSFLEGDGHDHGMYILVSKETGTHYKISK